MVGAQGRFRFFVGIGRALAIGVSLASGGCQGSYPLPPSPCDQWCDASQPTFCGNYDPAGCVLTCSERGGDAAECSNELETLIDCLHAQPAHELECGVWYNEGKLGAPCWAEEQTYEICAAPHAQNGQRGFGWR